MVKIRKRDIITIILLSIAIGFIPKLQAAQKEYIAPPKYDPTALKSSKKPAKKYDVYFSADKNKLYLAPKNQLREVGFFSNFFKAVSKTRDMYMKEYNMSEKDVDLLLEMSEIPHMKKNVQMFLNVTNDGSNDLGDFIKAIYDGDTKALEYIFTIKATEYYNKTPFTKSRRTLSLIANGFHQHKLYKTGATVYVNVLQDIFLDDTLLAGLVAFYMHIKNAIIYAGRKEEYKDYMKFDQLVETWRRPKIKQYMYLLETLSSVVIDELTDPTYYEKNEKYKTELVNENLLVLYKHVLHTPQLVCYLENDEEVYNIFSQFKVCTKEKSLKKPDPTENLDVIKKAIFQHASKPKKVFNTWTQRYSDKMTKSFVSDKISDFDLGDGDEDLSSINDANNQLETMWNKSEKITQNGNQNIKMYGAKPNNKQQSASPSPLSSMHNNDNDIMYSWDDEKKNDEDDINDYLVSDEHSTSSNKDIIQNNQSLKPQIKTNEYTSEYSKNQKNTRNKNFKRSKTGTKKTFKLGAQNKHGR